MIKQFGLDLSKPADVTAAVSPNDLARPGEATLADDRRSYILDGNKRNQDGHGPGRGTPGKSEFSLYCSDEKTIEVIKDVANDPASVQTEADGGRTYVNGTRDGIDVEVLIGRDGKAIITAYPTNVPRNERQCLCQITNK